jgi:hypothetical protein
MLWPRSVVCLLNEVEPVDCILVPKFNTAIEVHTTDMSRAGSLIRSRIYIGRLGES